MTDYVFCEWTGSDQTIDIFLGRVDATSRPLVVSEFWSFDRRIDRTAATLTLVRPGESPQLYATVPFEGYGNRFGDHVFPALRARMQGEPCDDPGMYDGLQAQLFADAAAESAKMRTWVAIPGESS